MVHQGMMDIWHISPSCAFFWANHPVLSPSKWSSSKTSFFAILAGAYPLRSRVAIVISAHRRLQKFEISLYPRWDTTYNRSFTVPQSVITLHRGNRWARKQTQSLHLLHPPVVPQILQNPEIPSLSRIFCTVGRMPCLWRALSDPLKPSFWCDDEVVVEHSSWQQRLFNENAEMLVIRPTSLRSY